MIYIEPFLLHIIICYIWIVEEIPQSWGIKLKPFSCGYCMNFWCVSALVFFRSYGIINDIITTILISIFSGILASFMTLVTPNIIILVKDYFIRLFFNDDIEENEQEMATLTEDELKILNYNDRRTV